MARQNNPEPINQAAALREMIGGYRATQLIYAVAELGIADLLSGGPRTSGELAESVGAQPRRLYRALRALASLGIFAENEKGEFALTPMAELLRTGVPGSLRAWALVNGNEWQRSWGELVHSLKTGKSSFDRVFGMDFWEYLAGNSEAAATFNEAMAENTEGIAGAVLSAYDFSGIETLVDVGGGRGALISSVLQAYPQMRGILFDSPETLEQARGYVEAQGVAGRCQLVPGDFFNSLPAGGDAYLLKWIIHDWDDEFAPVILRSCRRAMGSAGRLLLVERVIPSGNAPSEGKLGDIMMMALTGGVERTEAEYRALLHTAGIELTRVVPTGSPFSVIEGVSRGEEVPGRGSQGAGEAPED